MTCTFCKGTGEHPEPDVCGAYGSCDSCESLLCPECEGEGVVEA